MPNWLVRLRGEKFDLEDLPSLLRSPEHTVIEEDGSYYLKSSDFDSFSSADDVRKCAIKIIDWLNGAMKLRSPNFRSVFEDGVTFINEDGKRHHYVYLKGTIAARTKVSAELTTSNGTLQVAPQPSDVESWLSLAKRDKAVADAFHFFGFRRDWFNLYKVYEIIRDDVGGEVKLKEKNWVPNKYLKNFTRTAQSREAIGDDARHASEKPAPPEKNPMTRKEAESLIRKLLRDWLSSKTQRH